MRLTRLLVFRSIRARPLRLLLSTFGIVLGVAAILAIGITNQTALDSVTQLFANTSGKSNLIITSAEVESGGFSENVLMKVKDLPEIARAVPSLQVQTLLATESTPTEISLSFFGMESGGLLLYGIDPVTDPEVRVYKLVEGEFLSSGYNANEIVLVSTFAEENNLEVGDWAEIVAETGVEKLRVVGLMDRDGAGQLNNGAFGVFPLEVAQKLYYRTDEIDQIDLMVLPELNNKDGIDRVLQLVQSIVGESYSVGYPASQGQRMTQMLSNYQIGLNFMSGIALFVGAFLIFNSFSMTVVERTREFGMLRTVGMTRNQVTIQVLLEAAMLGLIGSGLGVAVGIMMARGLTRLMEIMLAQDMNRVDIPQDMVILGATIGVVVAVIAAVIPAYSAGRVSPLEALQVRGRGREGCIMRLGWIPGLLLLILSIAILIINPFPYDVQFRMGSMVVFSLFIGGTLTIPISVSIWHRVLGPILGLFFGRSGRLGSSNIQRSRLRTTLTVAALMIGVAMIVVVWAMTGSFKGDLVDWLEGYLAGDLYVTSSLPMGKDVWKRLEAVEGIDVATPASYLEVKWQKPNGEEETLTFMAVDPGSYSRVTTFLFEQVETTAQAALDRFAAGDAVYISSVIAEQSGLRPGDKIVLRTKTGEVPFHIAGVVVDYFNEGLVLRGSWQDMVRYFREKDATAFMLKVAPGYSADQVRNTIDDLYGKRYRLVVESNQSMLERIDTLMQQAFSMFDVLSIIAMAVGLFGIANTLTMNVIERTRELGMLRAIGMNRFQMIRMVLAEAALMGMIGGVLGVLFGVILARIFMMAMTAMSGYQLEFSLPPERILIGILIAVVVSQLAAFLPAMRAARLRILSAIQYE
jgi:putative ABC transport system permease protein